MRRDVFIYNISSVKLKYVFPDLFKNNCEKSEVIHFSSVQKYVRLKRKIVWCGANIKIFYKCSAEQLQYY